MLSRTTRLISNHINPIRVYSNSISLNLKTKIKPQNLNFYKFPLINITRPFSISMASFGYESSGFQNHLKSEIKGIKEAGLYKSERIIEGPQLPSIDVGGKKVLNLCANNYLGLSDNLELINAAKNGMDKFGFGMSSVRFICGTQSQHKELEADLSKFLGQEDTILYSSCFDANGGVFETLLGPKDAIISDALNHASIIDGIRLSKAKRFRYANSDMKDLEAKLKEADENGARFKLVVTDGVFSMDGYIAKLKEISELTTKYNALLMIDDSHAVGFMGENGAGTHEYCDIMDKVDILTGTLGKALGGASGGYVAARKEIVEILRQRSRPYLFSNSVAPAIVSASRKALEILGTEDGNQLRKQLKSHASYFREKMGALGFNLLPGDHPIIPVMFGDARIAAKVADDLLNEGVYVIAFSFPVVPKEQARIRVQMNAALTREELDKAINGFEKVGRKHGLIK